MYKFVFALIVVLSINSFALAQTETSNQWEYLIVSLSEFTTPLGEEAEIAKPKLLGKRTGTVGFHQQESYQKEFDRLGRFGWELVSVTPPNYENSSGNGQLQGSQFVFKRVFDAARTSREAEEKQKLDEQFQISSAQTKQNKPEIIDLDALESQQKTENLRRADEQKLRQDLENVKNVAVKVKQIRSFSIPDRGFNASAEIEIDGSAVLLREGNKFRLSEAEKYLKEKSIDVFNQIGLRTANISDQPISTYRRNNENISIKVSLVLNYQGTSKTVSQTLLSGVYINAGNR